MKTWLAIFWISIFPQNAPEEQQSAEPAAAEESLLEEWENKTVGRIKGKTISTKEILDYVESHFAPSIRQDLSHGYAKVHFESPVFYQWVQDYMDLKLLAPHAASRGILVTKEDVEREAEERAKQEARVYVKRNEMREEDVPAILSSLKKRILWNQGISVEKELTLRGFFPRPTPGEELRAHFVSNPLRFGGEVKVSQILLSTRDMEQGVQFRKEVRNALHEKAETLVMQLKDGGSFEELARIHSDDALTRERGGNLGYIKRTGPRPEPVTRAAFNHPPGTIVGPIQTEEGYHILKVVDRKMYRMPEFKEVLEAIEEDFFRERSSLLIEHLRHDGEAVIL